MIIESWEELLLQIRRHGNMVKLAKEAGIPRSHIYKVTSGDGNPTLKTLNSICVVLGVRLIVPLRRGAND